MKYLKRFNESVDESNIEEIKQIMRMRSMTTCANKCNK